MKYIVSGFILMVFLLIAKLLPVFYVDDIRHYRLASAPEKSSENARIHTGRSLYAVYCTSCHGRDGRGNRGKAQDHTRRISEKSVLHAIRYGANNFQSVYPSGMPGGLVTGRDAKILAAYVAEGMPGTPPDAWSRCQPCHGERGEGISFVAPNLRIYSDTLVRTVLTNGKKGAIGTMPSFDGRLTTAQMLSLASYIRSLNP